MKKFLLWLLVFVLGIAVGIGGYCGLKKVSTKDTEIKLTVKTMFIEDEYTLGDKVNFDVYAFSSTKLVRLTYSFDNETEVEIKAAKHGDTKDYQNQELVPEGAGDYYIDSGVQSIDTADMEEGFHSIIFYAYDSENNLIELMEKPIQFKLVAIGE